MGLGAADALIARVREAGVELLLEGKQLGYRPAPRLPDELLAELVEQRDAVVASLASDAEYEFEERAAILEFDAGMSRAEAERRAREMVNARSATSGPNPRNHRQGVTAPPEDPQGSHSAGNARSILISRCHHCLTSGWWRLRDAGNGRPGPWVCATCHPPMPAEALIEHAEASRA
jgi:hypothetical protein